ncbi:MAG TPA: acyl-CoA dehydrogenase family protein, partial [Dehalococcoidia bacterium]|nr:acyl-CoA dehydrogenase family protein [Dehalococcoidia bacterium]
MTLTASADLVETAASFSADIRAQADHAERQRRVDPGLVQRMAAAGLFHAFVPAALGGSESDVASVMRAIEQISIDDGSTGWVVMIGVTTGPSAAFLEPEAARKIYGDGPGVITGGAIAPKGKAVVDGHQGYRVSGRWPFVSGCEHSDWLLGSCLVYEGDELRNLPSGGPEIRQVFFPRAEVEILDTWDVSGLRATGSHDMAV